MTEEIAPNLLVHETSPYLLQHAHNPVAWMPWGTAALERAKAENKLLLISIGYSACHWCHVMERECFEDQEVAAYMNAHFVNIKVDREERPDVDAIYMDAVQLMRGSGGWPLNCIALPDARPIFGGTYYPKASWLSLLKQVAEFYEKDPLKANEFGANLTDAINQMETAAIATESTRVFTKEDLARIYVPLSGTLDMEEGGFDREPKFPLPVVWQFLLRYAHVRNDEKAQAALELTLRKMAWGGINDSIGGGFSRYSVDSRWHVPHFEKMLYDNAQLVSLYCEAYRQKPNPEWSEVVYKTLDFVSRELTHTDSGAFYSALDADSEGVEGKYYVWTTHELNACLAERAKLFSLVFNCTDAGNWEHGLNVLIRTKSNAEVAVLFGISEQEVASEIEVCQAKLLAERSNRVRPALDDKVIVAWNGLMCRAFVHAYRTFHEPRFLQVAIANERFLQQKHMMPDGNLLRTSKANRAAHINAYLDDYAYYMKALVALYQATFDRDYLDRARALMNYVIENFRDEQSGFFFYTSHNDTPLIARKMELHDSVIPSSNAEIAHLLLTLGTYFDRTHWRKMAHEMLAAMADDVIKFGATYGKWATLMVRFVMKEYQFAINGPEALSISRELDLAYIPNVLAIGAFSDSTLPLLRNKYVEGKTKIYVCRDRSCSLPVSTFAEAFKILQEMLAADQH